MRAGAYGLTALSAVLALAQPAAAEDAEGPDDIVHPAASAVVEVEAVLVNGRGRAASALADLQAVPGGVSVVSVEDVAKGRVFTNQDLLAFQPGVFAQAAAGADGIKLSIRGSAINRGANFFRTGVLLTFDGLPVNGPGGAPYELFEPLGLSYTEILRGANANRLGATALGGAINYATKTGREADKLLLRVEGGSFGYLKEQLASGQVIGPFDYFVSITNSERDGFQRNSQGRSFGVAANVGYQINDNLENRTFFRYRFTNNHTPGALTQAEVERDPRLANPTNIAQYTYRRQPGSTWIANKTTWRPDADSSLDVGFVFHDYPIDINGGVNRATWLYSDLSTVIRYNRDHALFGLDSRTTLGFLSTTHIRGWQKTLVRIPAAATAAFPVGTQIRKAVYDGSDNVVHIDNETDLSPTLHLATGLSAINIARSTAVTQPAVNRPYSRNEWDFAPRVGLRWEVTPDITVFGNVSRSIEPQNDWALLTTPPQFTSGPATGLAIQALDLKDQTANSYEVGTRGRAPVIGEWTLSLYRAEIKNELLSVEVQPATATAAAITAESNASPTIHQGVEASLLTDLWDGEHGRVTLQQSYTFNDFFFRNDPAFRGNQLPGVPRHFYQAGLTYEHPSGFYGRLTVDRASGYFADYANSVSVRPYTLLGATVGYDSPDGWSLFTDFRNLTDEHYVSSANATYNDRGVDQRRYIPGDGFSVSGGLTLRF